MIYRHHRGATKTKEFCHHRQCQCDVCVRRGGCSRTVGVCRLRIINLLGKEFGWSLAPVEDIKPKRDNQNINRIVQKRQDPN